MRLQGDPNPGPAPPVEKRSGFVEEQEETPSLPGFSSWRTVYWIVLAVFVLCIVLMRALQEYFS